MKDETDLKPEVVSEEGVKISEPEIVLDRTTQNKMVSKHEKNPVWAEQIRNMGRIGLSKSNIRTAFGLREHLLNKYYLEDYLAGVAEMQRGLATKAIEEAMNGNTPILLHLLKTKLGWSEQQIIEHVGEIKAVVSAKPLTKDEFVQKYLTEDEES
jgi:hypothetical protein